MIRTHILLTLVVGVGLSWTIWKHPPVVWTPTAIVGMFLYVAGFILWTVARFQLGASFSVKAEARQLVTRGLYSKVRNPIYVFGLCTIAGLLLVLNRPIWLLIYVVIIPLQIWRAGKEAQVLEAKFGEEYRKYRAGTWF